MPYDDAKAIETFENSYMMADRGSLKETFAAHLVEYDPDPAIAAIECPVAYIASDSMLSSLPMLKSKIKGIAIGKVIGSGHFAPLLVPHQVNAMIDRFNSV